MPLNVDLLMRVKKHIIAKPSRLRMDNWVVKGLPGDVHSNNLAGWNEPKKYKLPSCGTVGCIAGWVVLLANPEEATTGSIAVKAHDLLDMVTYREPFELFHVNNWPNELHEAYLKAKTQRERAKIVGQAIDQYIAGYKNSNES